MKGSIFWAGVIVAPRRDRNGIHLRSLSSMSARPRPPQRLARIADASRVSELMRASVRDLFPRFYDERQTASAAVHIAHLDMKLISDGTSGRCGLAIPWANHAGVGHHGTRRNPGEAVIRTGVESVSGPRGAAYSASAKQAAKPRSGAGVSATNRSPRRAAVRLTQRARRKSRVGDSVHHNRTAVGSSSESNAATAGSLESTQ